MNAARRSPRIRVFVTCSSHSLLPRNGKIGQIDAILNHTNVGKRKSQLLIYPTGQRADECLRATAWVAGASGRSKERTNMQRTQIDKARMRMRDKLVKLAVAVLIALNISSLDTRAATPVFSPGFAKWERWADSADRKAHV